MRSGEQAGERGGTPAPTRGTGHRMSRRLFALWRVPYSAGTARRFGYALLSLPVSIAALLAVPVGRAGAAARLRSRLAWRLLDMAPVRRDGGTGRSRTGWRGTAYALFSVPIGLVTYAVTAWLGWNILINLAYPFRPYLGLSGPAAGDIWANDYTTSWGGPTLAGAWALHAGVVLLTVVPLLGWIIRGLTRVQAALAARLLDVRAPAPAARVAHPVATAPVPPAPAVPPATPVAPAAIAPAVSPATPVAPAAIAPAVAPATTAPAAPSGPYATRAPGRRARVAIRALVVAALTGLFVAFSLAAHALGIGDNILWLPRGIPSALALAVTVAPLAVLPAALRAVPVRRRAAARPRR